MLPQFNYIVAQAGADAHLPPVPPSGLPLISQYSGSTSAVAAMANPQQQHQHQQQSSLQYRLDPQVAPPPPPPLRTPPFERHDQQQRTYYARQSPPPLPPPPAAAAAATGPAMRPPNHPHTVLPPPPSHIPYMASSNTYASKPTTSSSSSFRPLPPKWREFEHPAPPQVHPQLQHRSSIWHTPPTPLISSVTAPASSQPHHQQRPLLPPQPPSPPPPQPPSAPVVVASGSYEYDPYQSQWDQEEWTDAQQRKKLQMLRDCNDLLTTMNGEFFEHSTVIYKNKLQSLQEELRSIQEGTHEAFMEEITDLEMQREETIAHAKCMLNYHVSGVKRRYEVDMDTAEQDYDAERQSLHDTIMTAIDDRRKQIREDKDNSLDIKDLFRDACHRIHHTKRNLRKRHLDRNQINASPSRSENPKRRQTRPNNQASLNGSLNQREEDELNHDYDIMKGSKRQVVAVQ